MKDRCVPHDLRDEVVDCVAHWSRKTGGIRPVPRVADSLIRPSFVPPTPVEQLRMLTRTRKQLVREAAQHTQRIHKVLEDCNLKLTSVVTNVMGKTGRAILEALVQGLTDPEKLAELAAGSLRTKRAELVEARRGRVTAHHRFWLQLHLGLYDSVHRAVASIDQQVEDQLTPFRQAADLLETMPGLGRTAVEVILAEIGLDMERRPDGRTPAQLGRTVSAHG